MKTYISCILNGPDHFMLTDSFCYDHFIKKHHVTYLSASYTYPSEHFLRFISKFCPCLQVLDANRLLKLENLLELPPTLHYFKCHGIIRHDERAQGSVGEELAAEQIFARFPSLEALDAVWNDEFMYEDDEDKSTKLSLLLCKRLAERSKPVPRVVNPKKHHRLPISTRCWKYVPSSVSSNWNSKSIHTTAWMWIIPPMARLLSTTRTSLLFRLLHLPHNILFHSDHSFQTMRLSSSLQSSSSDQCCLQLHGHPFDFEFSGRIPLAGFGPDNGPAHLSVSLGSNITEL